MSGEMDLTGPGGGRRVRPVRIPLRAGSGRSEGLLAVGFDLTAREQAGEHVALLRERMGQGSEAFRAGG